jgi:hypothetical protein
MSIAVANKYWLAWFLVLLISFLVPELYSLFSHRAGGTLSETIWRLEGLQPDGRLRWNAFHFLFIGELLILDVWLLAHFGWRLFR